MNSFRPIRPYYRNIVGALIPSHLRFKPSLHDRSSVELDCDWMQAIYDATPEKYLDDLVLRIDSINCLFLSVLPKNSDMQQFLRLPVNASTIAMISEYLALHDRKRQERRLATSIEMIRHELGVERTYLPFNYLN